MPVILNGAGLSALNGNNGPLSLSNGRVLLVGGAGSARALDDNRIIFQHMIDGGAQLSILHIDTGEIEPAERNSDGTVKVGGCDWLKAGKGRWAARGGFGAYSGYRDCFGHTNPDWLPYGVDAVTGKILVCLSYATGSGLGLWDGIILERIYEGQLAAPLAGAAAINNGQVVARVIGGAGRLSFFPPRPWPSFFISNHDFQDGWVAGWDLTYRLVAWEAGPSPMGYVLNFDETDHIGHDYNVSVKRLDNGHILVVSSRGPGEAPGELNRYEIDPVARTVNGQAVADHVRPAKVAYLDLTQPLTDIPTVDLLPPFEPTTRKVFVVVMDEPNQRPIIWGTVDKDSVSAILESVKRAERLGEFFFGYNDEGSPRPDKTPKGHFALVRTYPNPGESSAAAAARARADVKMMQDRGYRCASMSCGFLGVKGDGTYHRTLDIVRKQLRADFQMCREGLLEGMVIFNFDKSWYTPNAINRMVPDGVSGFSELLKDVQAIRYASADWQAFPVPSAVVVEDEEMIVPGSKVKQYWEWPTTHAVVIGDDGRFLVVDRERLANGAFKTANGLKWVKGENRAVTPQTPLLPDHVHILSGEAWERVNETTLVARHNGIPLVLKVDVTQ